MSNQESLYRITCNPLYMSILVDRFKSLAYSKKHSIVTEELFFEYLPKVITELNRLETIPTPHIDTHAHILFKIYKAIRNYDKVYLLSSGGWDSLYLLAQIQKVVESKRIKIISFQGKSDIKSIAKLSRYCVHNGIKNEIVYNSYNSLHQSLLHFCRNQKRLPRDVAYPAVFAMMKHIQVDCLDSSYVVIDGQYADTIFYSNPQNKFIQIWKFFGIFPFLRDFSGTFLKNKFIQSSLQALTLPPDRTIAFLCRFEQTISVLNSINSLLGDSFLDIEIIFQYLFRYILLNVRERDKYVCFEHIYSPFDDADLFADASFRTEYYRSILQQKTHLKRFLFDEDRSLFAICKSDSFIPGISNI